MTEYYYHRLVGPEPKPEFQDPAELERYWGRRWGAADEVSPLRTVLVRRPSRGLAAITADAWDPEADALVDPAGRWYWRGKEAPDLDLVDEQHAGLVAALRDEGVEVIQAPMFTEGYPKSVFTRDPLLTVPGGAVVTRLAPRMRRGEEASVTRAVAALGMPILGTITGHGMVEGGTFVKIRRDLAVYGLSIRCNAEGLRQLSGLLEPIGMEVLPVPLPGYTIHIDGQFHMVDEDLALANVHRLPYEFLQRLDTWGIKVVAPDPDEQTACNALTVRPRRLLFPAHCPRTAEMLVSEGVEIVPVGYDEIVKNGGGIHCSTMELVRDW